MHGTRLRGAVGQRDVEGGTPCTLPSLKQSRGRHRRQRHGKVFAAGTVAVDGAGLSNELAVEVDSAVGCVCKLCAHGGAGNDQCEKLEFHNAVFKMVVGKECFPKEMLLCPADQRVVLVLNGT
ncbi:hypothetical protein D3C72_2010510 [compost metagenome]